MNSNHLHTVKLLCGPLFLPVLSVYWGSDLVQHVIGTGGVELDETTKLLHNYEIGF